MFGMNTRHKEASGIKYKTRQISSHYSRELAVKNNNKTCLANPALDQQAPLLEALEARRIQGPPLGRLCLGNQNRLYSAALLRPELRIEDYIANRKTPSASGGLFGSSTATNAGSSIFGSTPAKPSLFGSSTCQTTSGGLFGNTQKPGGLFGSTTNTTGGFGAAAPTTINVPAAAPIVLGSDVNQAQIQMALLDAQIAACPYGDSPLLKMGSAKDTDDTPNPIKFV
ncbi:hypothetical protein TELCIR_16793 [Teladorsagia circumcincta]|uniref:Uncharacterized protein n=1 Tax=Teladorsagia circumcincta TaxID=45464 RepID=A0A2G9TUI4_TELCI|nr:hypothetical protein TELCIR_16793 [Teladorsagia circumcincta]